MSRPRCDAFDADIIRASIDLLGVVASEEAKEKEALSPVSDAPSLVSRKVCTGSPCLAIALRGRNPYLIEESPISNMAYCQMGWFCSCSGRRLHSLFAHDVGCYPAEQSNGAGTP